MASWPATIAIISEIDPRVQGETPVAADLPVGLGMGSPGVRGHCVADEVCCCEECRSFRGWMLLPMNTDVVTVQLPCAGQTHLSCCQRSLCLMFRISHAVLQRRVLCFLSLLLHAR
mmetsp:Transcript_101001/g.324315  ORF Transcript_101001/g.324315 Transcript_101001/m.324315 type:complete len:116 (+) Transcript_101001:246-593(+)